MKQFFSTFAALFFFTVVAFDSGSFAQEAAKPAQQAGQLSPDNSAKKNHEPGNRASENQTREDVFLVDGREAEALVIHTGQGSFQFSAEIADTPEKSAKGLMFRKTLPPKHGMLFDFATPRLVMMWMKNTPVPLDMIFLSSEGKVVHIEERTIPFSESIITSRVGASAVLEVNAGIAKLIGLKKGDRIEHRIFSNAPE